MPIKLQSTRRIALIDEVVINISRLDNDDMNAILQDKGLIPLSRDERIYLEALHENLSISTSILENIIPILDTHAGLSDEDKRKIFRHIEDAVDESRSVLCVKIDDIGHGHAITKEEIT